MSLLICILHQIQWGQRVKSRRMKRVMHVVHTERRERVQNVGAET